MRPAGTRGEDEIAPKDAATTAHTIWIHPTLNAKLRRQEATAERILEPGTYQRSTHSMNRPGSTGG